MFNHNVPYLAMSAWDTISRMKPQIENAGYYLRDDGKIDCKRKMFHDPPWVYTKHNPNPMCHLAHHILFNIFFKESKVPSMCMECWKVVIAPRNVRELFAIWVIQNILNRPSKCGSEGDRENSNRLYGGYWYNKSIEEGRDCYEIVRKEIAQFKTYEFNFLGTSVPVWIDKDFFDNEAENSPLILKRACTEFEQACGPSDQWQMDKEQLDLEEIVKATVCYEPTSFQPAEHQVAHTMKKWLHNAYKWGDDTYKHFTEGNPLFPACVTYHKTLKGENNNGKNGS